MATVLIHYFTGTGNTAHAVGVIQKELQAAGFEVTTTLVKQGISPSTESFDYHIIAFPVLSWAPPVMMSRYLKAIPLQQGQKAAIIAINGAIMQKGKVIPGYTGQALEEAESILKKKNLDVFLTANASYPDNWTQMTNPCTEECSRLIIAQGEVQVQAFVHKFITQERELYRCGAFNKAWSWLISGAFGKVGRRVLGTFFIADDQCTGCGLCAKTCPAKTIVMENQLPHWKSHCEDCNRCINVCPEKAIQVSVPLMVAQLSLNLLFTAWFIKSFLEYTTLLFFNISWIKIFIDIPLICIAILLAAWVNLLLYETIFKWLMRIPTVRRYLSSRSFTKSFRRYVAPGFKAGKF